MDFLNKTFAQLIDLFRAMTPSGRIATGLVLVVTAVSVGYLFQHQANGDDEYLFGGASMQTPTLQKMEEAFGKAGLNGFTMEGGRVKVPHVQRAAYLAALADAKALPLNFGDSFKEDGSLFESPLQRQQRQERAKEADLSLVISSMKGIERASVIIDKQAQSGFDSTPLKTASVTVWGIAGVPLDDDQIDKIRYCVVFANAGMKPENVTIVDANGTVHLGDAKKGGPGDNDPYNRAQRIAEHDLNDKIRKALSFIPNPTVISTVTLGQERGGPNVEVKSDLKLAKVSVGIPASYYETVWQDRNASQARDNSVRPDRAAVDKICAEITQNVRNIVTTLLPPAPDVKDLTSLVSVTTFQDIKAGIPGPPPTQRALVWLGQNWPMVAMLGLLAFSLGMLPSMLRTAPAPSAAAMRATAAARKPKEFEEPVEATTARRAGHVAGSGPSLRDELSELVREDPDSAANILRAWIGQGS